MKVGTITTPNAKGQIVIPKAMRETLGIDAQTHVNLVLRGGGIYIYPLNEVITKHETDNSYLKILEKTRGAFRDDKNWETVQKQRRKLELEATRKNKRAW